MLRGLTILAVLSMLLGSPSLLPATEPAVAPVIIRPPVIAAFYYPWYGTPAVDGTWVHWQGQNQFLPPPDIASDFYPELGAYSSHDPSVIAQHMQWLRQSGIDLIVVSWWGQGSFEDQAVPELLRQAEENGLQVAFHMEPHGGRTVDQLVADVQYLYDRYGDAPAFYRSTIGSGYNAAGKASGLFFLWNPNVQHTGGPPADAAYWQPALDRIHALADGGLVMVQSTDPAWIDAGHFDGAYDYTNLDSDVPLWGSRLPAGAWFIPAVIPGFSPQRIHYPPSVVRGREGGVLYDRQWRGVLESGRTPEVIAVTSFNEWHEGSQIEPAASGADNGRGYAYLDYTLGAMQYLTATAEWATAARALPNVACMRQISITLQATNQGTGLYQHDLEDGLTAAVELDGRAARQAIDNGIDTARYIYLWVQRDYQYAWEGPLLVEVTYYDAGADSFRLDYDSTDGSQPLDGAYKPTAAVAITGTNTWRRTTFGLPDAYFGDRQNGGADLRIAVPDVDFAVAQVTVTKFDAPCAAEFLYLPAVARP